MHLTHARLPRSPLVAPAVLRAALLFVLAVVAGLVLASATGSGDGLPAGSPATTVPQAPTVAIAPAWVTDPLRPADAALTSSLRP
jgi:hypothetical protein